MATHPPWRHTLWPFALEPTNARTTSPFPYPFAATPTAPPPSSPSRTTTHAHAPHAPPSLPVSRNVQKRKQTQTHKKVACNIFETKKLHATFSKRKSCMQHFQNGENCKFGCLVSRTERKCCMQLFQNENVACNFFRNENVACNFFRNENVACNFFRNENVACNLFTMTNLNAIFPSCSM